MAGGSRRERFESSFEPPDGGGSSVLTYYLLMTLLQPTMETRAAVVDDMPTERITPAEDLSESDSTWRSFTQNAPRGAGLRLATPADIELIADIGLRSYPIAHRDVMDGLALTVQAQLQYSREELRARLVSPASLFLLATWKSHPTGYTQLTLGNRPEDPNPSSIELKGLYVKPDWVGNGVGEQLLQAAKLAAREHGARQLWVAIPRVSRKVIGFFERYGFEAHGAEIRILGSKTCTFVTLIATL